MTSELSQERQIIDSWHKNAAPWIVAIQERQIVSRQLVTDRAIVDTVASYGGNTVLDLGCGEGWLTRALVDLGLDVLGTDIVPELIERARQSDRSRFELASYAEIAAGKLSQKFDLAIANFSLLGDESVRGLFRSMPTLLHPGGAFIVQTLHPTIACGNLPYVDGWRNSSWAGFSDDFSDPAPWYFRTLTSWVELYTTSGLKIVEIREPLHPHTHQPASAIFVGVSIN